jgi:hypothetical protein
MVYTRAHRLRCRWTVLDELLPRRDFSVGRLLRRYWTGLLLGLFVIGGLASVGVGLIAIKDFALGLVVPVVLFVVQIVLDRRREAI